MPSVKLASFSAFFALVSALILTAINSHVPDAYMVRCRFLVVKFTQI